MTDQDTPEYGWTLGAETTISNEAVFSVYHERYHASAFPILPGQTTCFSRRMGLQILTDMRKSTTPIEIAFLFLVVSIVAAGCSSTAPTAPTPASVVTQPPAVVVTPPVVVTPATPTTDPFPPNDPRFDLTFYRQFVHDAFDSPQRLDILRRQRVAPRIYLRTVHANGTPIDASTLDQTAAALINTAGSLTGVFGLAGLERGTGSKAGEPGWITVSWKDDPNRQFCGYSDYGGDYIDLFTNTPGCRCAGGPAVRLRTVKHELGHALGFRHTSSTNDLMYGAGSTACDQSPSAREIYHASVAYQRPVGSAAP